MHTMSRGHERRFGDNNDYGGLAMNLRNCSRCGKMFNYISGEEICENCKKELEDSFQTVKKFVEENPGAGLKEIAEKCEVTTKQIKKWIIEERLMFSKDSPLQLTCENCGTRIPTGRLCAKCKASMANNLTNTFQKPKPVAKPEPKKEEKAGMHFIQK